MLDYYQGVVMDYLRTDRSVFINPECCIQLNEGKNNDIGPFWYCDIIAVRLSDQTVFLCEVSYSQTLGALLKRLRGWNTHWPQVKASLVRDCHLPANWSVSPWLFVPQYLVARLHSGVQQLGLTTNGPEAMPMPQITALEAVVPWYSANEKQEKDAGCCRRTGTSRPRR